MRFVQDGVDIPAELVAAQEAGRTIFVCGAGVSVSANLPLFRGLVEGVYGKLGEHWSLHPAEREGMEPGGKLQGQYDRVLRCLERRLAASDAPSRRGMRERIRRAVQDILTISDDADLENHATLLELSRDEVGRIRLLTTNFDTGFERAWLARHGQSIASHAGVALPQPRTARCEGVLHLHGRLHDLRLGLEPTDLVLTSAEFGDAYLRSGWASRYIADLLRAHILVLVGYQADDPPMRYLLEALEADRERFPDLQNVYAFASTTKNDVAETAALWEAKGIIPIPYTLVDDRHDTLYRTLREWKNYAEDPTAWRRSRLRTIFAVSPSEQNDELVGESISLLGHADATQLLGDLSPSSEWFAILRERRLFLSGRVTPSLWLASRTHDPKIIGEAAALPSLDGETRWHVDRALEVEEAQLNPLFRRAWELLLNAKRPQNESYDDNWYSATIRIKRGDTGYQIRALIAHLLRPRLKVARPVRFRHEDVEAAPTSLLDLIWIDFEASEDTPVTEILAAWPQELEAEKALFRQLERIYLETLEEAEDVGFINSWDRADSDVPSIAPHPQNAHRSGFYPMVRALADLWQRIATRDAACGRELATAFVNQRFHLTRRLQLFSLSHEIFSTVEAEAFLLKVDDDLFWSETAQVELMRLLTTRWSTLGANTRSAIEARLCAGVPRDRYSPDAFANEEEWESIHDYSVYRRLTRLQATGALLGPETLEKLRVIQTRHPRWKPNPGDRDDFYAWHESSGGTAGDPTLLAGVSDEALVQEAMRIQREERFEQGDVWWAFCSADPNRAIRGLQSDEKSGRWDVTAWSTLLRAASHLEDADIALDIAASLLGMSHSHLKHLSTAAVSWLQFRRAILESAGAEGSRLFLQLWDRLANIAFRPPAESIEENGVDASEGIGSVLALIALESLVSKKPAHKSGIGSVWTGRFDVILGAGNRAGLSALTYLVRHIARLDWIDPAWTAEKLVPLLSWDHPHGPTLLRSYARAGLGSAQLFNAMKSAALRILAEAGLADHEYEGVVDQLMIVAINHRRGRLQNYDLVPSEVRRVLTIAPGTARRHAAWMLWRTLTDDKGTPADRAERWRMIIGPLFADIWPLDARLRSKSASQRLVLMALDSEAAFPEAVEAIADFLVPYELYSMSHTFRLEHENQKLFKNHPAAFLKLANALIDPTKFRVPSDLGSFLRDCVEADRDVSNESAYTRLWGINRQRNA